jgi:formamidopyrimidine-DNA glycosylase
MPELPEVETIVRTYRPRLEGRRIVAFASRWAKQAWPSVAAVRRAIVGRRIASLGRRGKFIVFRLDPPGYLLVHLRMSGQFEWAADHEREPRHVRTIWDLDEGGRLLFCDARKFGRIVYADDLAAATGALGDEPLARTFTAARLHELLARRSRWLKPLLLDQKVIAGLGNIYADESLFRAGLHPLLRSDRVQPPQAAALHAAIRTTLREAIRRHGTSIDWIYPDGWMQNHLMVYGRAGEPCRRCGTPIEALRVGQRGTHVCPKCQPRNGVRRTGRGG